MSADRIRDDVLEEAVHDWINFAFIAQRIEAEGEVGPQEPQLSRAAVETAVELVRQGLLVPGALTVEGLVPWNLDREAAVVRLRADAEKIIAAHGHIPLAEVCWFGLPSVVEDR